MTPRGGGHVPLTMKLIKQADGWKVLSLEGPKAGAAISTEAKQVPPEAELRKLTDRTLLDFNEAIQAKSFATFYQTISALWKSQITAEKFQGRRERTMSRGPICLRVFVWHRGCARESAVDLPRRRAFS